MATQEQKARRQFAVVLGYQAIQKINFTFDGITVSPPDYARISRAIVSGKIKIAIDNKLGKGKAGASYRAMDNLISVSFLHYGVYPKEKVTIVHECTHAVLDMHRIRTTDLKGEVVAYIADAIFQLAAGFEFTTKSRIHPTGVAIAQNMLSTGRRNLKVGDPDIAILATAIINNPTYLDSRDGMETEYRLNGIKGA